MPGSPIGSWWRSLFLSVIVFALFVTSCSRKAPKPDSTSQLGVASWYGHPFDGRLTANGETFDMEKLTAAHRTFPFGTVLRVENLSNSKTVQVRVNDRGPFVQGRIIDLSHAAAQSISMAGIANVRLQVISIPPTRSADLFAVQIQTFTQRSDAEKVRTEMAQKYGNASVRFRPGDQTWRVLVGLEPTMEGANALAQKLDKEAGPAFVVLVDSD